MVTLSRSLLRLLEPRGAIHVSDWYRIYATTLQLHRSVDMQNSINLMQVLTESILVSPLS